MRALSDRERGRGVTRFAEPETGNRWPSLQPSPVREGCHPVLKWAAASVARSVSGTRAPNVAPGRYRDAWRAHRCSWVCGRARPNTTGQQHAPPGSTSRCCSHAAILLPARGRPDDAPLAVIARCYLKLGEQVDRPLAALADEFGIGYKAASRLTALARSRKLLPHPGVIRSRIARRRGWGAPQRDSDRVEVAAVVRCRRSTSRERPSRRSSSRASA